MRGIAAASAFLALTSAQAQPNAPIVGRWKNPSGSAIIAIAPCGGVLCGKVVWASARGKQEAARSTSQVVGTTVLSGLRAAGAQWAGTLFIPDDGIRVAAKLQPLDERRLKLTGCAFAGLFCRSQIWTRHDGALPSSH